MITNKFGVADKVAIVTGAGRGIGKAIALTLAEAGADVTEVSRTTSEIEQTAEEVQKLGRKALAITADISQADQIKMIVAKTLSEFGKIDIMCNNAAMAMFKAVSFIPGMKVADWNVPYSEEIGEAQTLEEWHKVMDTNLTSAFLFAQAVGPYMLRQKKGKFISTSSANADEGVPGMSIYGVSKAGLSSFTRALASEWGPYNINVNAVAPGLIVTGLTAPLLADPEVKRFYLNITPLGRLGEPEEVALLVLFLASEASNYITGQIFTIDGGAMGKGPCI